MIDGNRMLYGRSWRWWSNHRGIGGKIRRLQWLIVIRII